MCQVIGCKPIHCLYDQYIENGVCVGTVLCIGLRYISVVYAYKALYFMFGFGVWFADTLAT